MKKKFKRKNNPFPLLLSHFKWREKKNNLPPPQQLKKKIKKNQSTPLPLNNEKIEVKDSPGRLQQYKK
jgi:hypothetical protein